MDELQRGTLEQTGALPVEGSPRAEAGGVQVADLRDSIDRPGQYLVYDESGSPALFDLAADWIRVGRSLSADVRFDDATVSRRHALLTRGPEGLRVLDDRSLNGVYVNGERVESSLLRDGDEIVVGRHCLYFIDVVEVVARPLGAVGAAPAAAD